jgi:uncharacterized protein YecE (DUF72 family)
LPRDTDAAAALARRRNEKVKGRARLAFGDCRPLRHALEVRHETFVDEAFVELLRREGVALVIADTAGKWPYAEDVTAEFVYARLHGDKELYISGYTGEALDRWAARVVAWSEGRSPRDARHISAPPPTKSTGRDVFCYFDNDVKVKAPGDAASLAERIRRAGGNIMLPQTSSQEERMDRQGLCGQSIIRQQRGARGTRPTCRRARASAGHGAPRPRAAR